MATTFTSKLRFSQLGSGNRNVWGGVLNDGATLAENSITGVISVDMSLGDVVATANNGAQDQARYAVIRAVGNPGVATRIVLPNTNKLLVAVNDTSPGFTVTFATSVGGVVVLPGYSTLLWVDADDGVVREVSAPNNVVATPTGMTTYSAIPSIPASGFMEVKAMLYGTMVVGLARITSPPTVATATVVFDTSPYLPSTMNSIAQVDFPCQISEGGTRRDCFMRIPAAGGDWTFNRVSGAFGAASAKSPYGVGYIPFYYPVV